jgi:hypothetical protein
MIVAELETDSGALGETTEALAHRLPHRLERREAVGPLAGMNADALGRAMVDRDEHRRLALADHHRGQVGAPHDIDPLGGDRAVVGARAVRPANTLVGQEAVLAHQPQDAAPAGADAGEAQPRPQLAVALTWGLGCQDAQSSMVIISWWCGGGPEVKGAAASAGLRSGTLELGDGSARHWCLACAAVPAGQALSGKLTTSDPRGSSPSRPTAASAAQPHIRPGSFGP